MTHTLIKRKKFGSRHMGTTPICDNGSKGQQCVHKSGNAKDSTASTVRQGENSMRPMAPHTSPQKGPALPSPDHGLLADGNMSYISHLTSQNAPNGENWHAVPLRNRKVAAIGPRGFPQLPSRIWRNAKPPFPTPHWLAESQREHRLLQGLRRHLSKNQVSHSERPAAPESQCNHAYCVADTSKGLCAPNLLVRITHEKTDGEG